MYREAATIILFTIVGMLIVFACARDYAEKHPQKIRHQHKVISKEVLNW